MAGGKSNNKKMIWEFDCNELLNSNYLLGKKKAFNISNISLAMQCEINNDSISM